MARLARPFVYQCEDAASPVASRSYASRSRLQGRARRGEEAQQDEAEDSPVDAGVKCPVHSCLSVILVDEAARASGRVYFLARRNGFENR